MFPAAVLASGPGAAGCGCGGGTAVITASFARTPPTQATLTCWPTFTSDVDGEAAPIEQVRSRSPSCKEIESAESAVIAPPNVTGFVSLAGGVACWAFTS